MGEGRQGRNQICGERMHENAGSRCSKDAAAFPVSAAGLGDWKDS